MTPLPGGPAITFFGLAETAGGVATAAWHDTWGRPVYVRPHGKNFLIVVEAKRGPNNFEVGRTVFDSNPDDPTVRPDLQLLSSEALGTPTTAVCDKDGPAPDLGGVPAVDPPQFDVMTQAIADAMNDLACRFVPRIRNDEACTRDSHQNYSFVSAGTEVQFCLEPAVGNEIEFAAGRATVLTVRVRNVNRGLGEPAQIVVQVQDGP